MTILVYATRWSTEGAFEGETIDQTELSPHHYTSCRFTRFLNNEVTVWETEMFSVTTKQIREYSLFQAVTLLIRTAVHEQIFLPRVTMKITKE